jgi:hypothetical protein
VQSYLINLKLAFNQHVLPPGWELRVATDTAVPYWVDHINRVASTLPPPRPLTPPLPDTEIRSGSSYPTLDTLPEYHIHVHKFTQLLDQLDRCNLTYSRHRARISLLNHYGGGDSNARKVGSITL